MPRFSFPMFASALVRALLVACIGGITIVAEKWEGSVMFPVTFQTVRDDEEVEVVS